MSPLCHLPSIGVALAFALTTLSTTADAQQRGRAAPRPAADREQAIVAGGPVFVGGYFYDPTFGPYPWWPAGRYPRWYVPVYDSAALLRVRVTPQRAAVYVDGFYAGIVEDFAGVFEGLPLTPGGHRIVLYLEGYRTAQHDLYLRPGSTSTLHDTLVRLPAGLWSCPPDRVRRVPLPPTGTYTEPRTPPPLPPLEPDFPAGPETAGVGIAYLPVQPPGSAQRFDPDGRHLVLRRATPRVALPAGQAVQVHAGRMERGEQLPWADPRRE
jgi:hypothetical protein